MSDAKTNQIIKEQPARGSMRNVKDTTFNGPLDLLLQLIEQDELDINQISLARVTEGYIAELQKMAELPLDELADFLVVAAKLLLIKSRTLLPGEPEPDDAGLDLERQLRMYRAFVEASRHIAKAYHRRRVTYAREGYAFIEPIFNPPTHVKVDDLRTMILGVLRELEPITRLPQTVIVRTINIREKIVQIKDQLLSAPRMSFYELLGSVTSKTEIIVTFLALLELVKQRSIVAVQGELHTDVAIELVVEPTRTQITAEVI